MKQITTKQFQIFSDVNLVWDFLVETYDRKSGGRIAAPFFEYAISSSWMDISYTYLERLWFNGQEFLKETAKKRGFRMSYEYEEREFDFQKELNYKLPEKSYKSCSGTYQIQQLVEFV